MTQLQALMLARLKELRSPKRATMGGSAGGMGGAAEGAPIDPMADQGPVPMDQGPTQTGGYLGQPAQQSWWEKTMGGGGQSGGGRLPGKNRFSIGNARNGTIDLGSLLSARTDPNAQAQLNADPLADVQRYKEAGFFRTLLGDDANERNERDAASRGQLLTQKWLMDQDVSGKRALFNEQQAARTAQDVVNHQQAKELGELGFQQNMGVERYRSQGDLEKYMHQTTNDLLKDTRNNLFTAQQNAAQRGTIERGQDLTADWRGVQAQNQMLRALAGGEGGGLGGFKVPAGMGYDPDSGNYTLLDSVDNRLLEIPRRGGSAPNMGPQSPGNLRPAGTTKPAAPTPEIAGALKSEFGTMAANQAAAPIDMSQPTTAFDGIKELGGELAGGVKGFFSDFKAGAMNNDMPIFNIPNRIAGFGEELSSYADQVRMEKDRKRLERKLLESQQKNRPFPSYSMPAAPDSRSNWVL